jgi:glycerol-3-phosphate O-acyltransferase
MERKLSELAIESGTSLEHLTILARRYTKEIAADINYTLVELADRFMAWIFKKLYENISVDTNSLAQIKGLSAYTTLVFVPNHRSHVDYLLLSHIFYRNNMNIPHIAAGMNLAFWPLGPIFRRLGAYFIRRTFQGNQVYREVFKTYLSVLLQEGYSQEFFIEGGRSRTGKLRPPKMGMLSMLTDSVIDRAVDDVIFVPVSITYEQVIEQKSYMTELAGGEKKPERKRDIVGLTKFLRRQKEGRGAIYVRFGTPVSISGAAHKLGFDYPISAENKSKVVGVSADQICHEINKNVVITPLAVAAMALLLKPRRAVTVEDFEKRIAAYIDYLEYKNVELTDSLRDHPLDATRDALSHLIKMNMVRYHDDPEFPFYEVLEDKRIVIDYYKNTAVHFIGSLSFLCTALKRLDLPSKFGINRITEELVLLQMIFQFEFRFSPEMPIEERIQHLLTFLEQKNVIKTEEDGQLCLCEVASEALDVYAELVRNYLDAYKGALFVLRRNADRPQDEKVLVKQMLEACPKLFLMGYLSRREAVSKENFAHALNAFHALNAIDVKEKESKGKNVRIITVHDDKIKFLQEELERVT